MQKQPIIVRNGEGARFPIGPTLITVKVGSETTPRLFLAEHLLPPGFAGPPPHHHAEMDHVLYVLSGQVRVRVGDDATLLDHGDVAYVPRGTSHGFGNVGTSEARLLEFNLPGGFDRYYAELAAAFPPGAEVVPEIVRGIMMRHDILPE